MELLWPKEMLMDVGVEVDVGDVGDVDDEGWEAVFVLRFVLRFADASAITDRMVRVIPSRFSSRCRRSCCCCCWYWMVSSSAAIDADKRVGFGRLVRPKSRQVGSCSMSDSGSVSEPSDDEKKSQ